MTASALQRRALAALFVGEGALVAAALVADGSLLLAAGGALAALLLGVAWLARSTPALFYASAAAACVPAFTRLTQPMGLETRLLAVAGALGVVSFVEYGHLAGRVSEAVQAEGGGGALDAMRARLTRALAFTSVVVVGLVTLAGSPGPWFDPTVGSSVELAGSLGAVVLGLLAALSLIGGSRAWRRYRSREAEPPD